MQSSRVYPTNQMKICGSCPLKQLQLFRGAADSWSLGKAVRFKGRRITSASSRTFASGASPAGSAAHSRRWASDRRGG